MHKEANKNYAERRRGPDIFVKLVHWIGIIAWIFATIILVIIEAAKPEFETFFDRMLNLHLRTTWDLDVAQYAFLFMLLLFYVCVIAILINSRRMKRKTDRFNKSIIALAILSLIGIVVYIFSFIL